MKTKRALLATASFPLSNKNSLRHFIQLALVGSVLTSGMAVAALQDHGGIADNSGATVNGTQITPAATLNWPAWYRDNSGLALGLCKSQLASPNPAAASAPMCFPITPNPVGFAGNVGDEIFYMNMGVSMKNAGMELRYDTGLEAAYATATPVGSPKVGQEVVFTRVRFLMHITTPECAGTYRIIHPWGDQPFPDVPVGKRALFVTLDLPVGAPLDFDGAINGPMGPFLHWDDGNEVLLPRTVANGLRIEPLGGLPVAEFIGDPSVPHTYTGSPHIETISDTDPSPRYTNPVTHLPVHQNYVKIIAPAGCIIGSPVADGGEGANVMKEPLGTLMGQVWNTPIATPTHITQAEYTRSVVNGAVTVDVWAKSIPGKILSVTGTDLSGVKMTEELVNASGSKYQAHIVLPATAKIPASVTVVNESSNPILATSAALVDIVHVSKADFDPFSGKLCVSAQSSDDQILTLTTASGAIVGQLDSTTKAGCTPAMANDLTAVMTVPLNQNPPENVVVESSTFGSTKKPVTVLANTPDNTAVLTALPDIFGAVSGGTPTDLDVGLNDSARGQVVVVSQPAITVVDPKTGLSSTKIVGTATGLAGGHITFTPISGASDTATLSYFFKDAAGNASNVVNVSFPIQFVATPPTAVPDNFAVLRNGATATNSFTANVLSNDVAATGSPIDVATVQLRSAVGGASAGSISTARGNIIVNSDGSIKYTPKVNVAAGTDVFWYTAKSTAQGTTSVESAPVRVDVAVENAPESLSITRLRMTKQGTSAKWDIRFTTGWFGAPLTPTGSCYITIVNGVSQVTAAQPLGQLIGTVPVDTVGGFLLQFPSTLTTGQAYTVSCRTSNFNPPATVTGTGTAL